MRLEKFSSRKARKYKNPNPAELSCLDKSRFSEKNDFKLLISLFNIDLSVH